MQTNNADLADRIGRLEDLEAIRNRWYDYLFALDSSNWSALADVFTEDGTVEMVGLDAVAPGSDRSYTGRTSIIEDFYRPVIDANCVPERGIFYTGHHGTNMKIDLAGDSATTLAYFFEIVGNSSMVIGTYQHRFVRELDAWRMAFLRIAVRYSATVSVSDLSGLSLQDVLRMAAP
ncbi:MAG TPA: nuclear transport factor 2 family protein [Pseudonocardia sp.]|nr:nuclear transport factor 2 family protein [Pseudonocardia sp.]